MNRLAQSTSPYLLQHAYNPVDWWPWSDEAFAEARRRDVPVLLSVGYAACHWCHVMAHEAFENVAVAQQMNAGFVNIKVDREERPDVDAVYMEATQALTGSGGWPMTCLLTADGAPFYCGTYFPPQQFRQLLSAVSDAWRDRRSELLDSSEQIVAALSSSAARPSSGAPDAAALDEAAAVLARSADPIRGGFGGAPKFPPAMPLEFLLRHFERTGARASLDVVERTGEAMARGGMYDQLAGGFARYSVDANWVVPHFEKMLYDNALLLRFYLHWYRRTGSPLAARITDETAEFLIRDLGTPEGGFASALDADTDGVEGLTYAWTPAQLLDVLGADDGGYAAQLLTVTPPGTFEHGASTLQLRADPDDLARWASIRARLLQARAQRPQPGRDDKVVTAWNGLALGALAEAAMVRERPDWLVAATRCAELLAAVHLRDGRLVRTSRDGLAGPSAAVSDDYGCLAEGVLLLHQATADTRWLTLAAELLEVALTRFTDSSAVGGAGVAGTQGTAATPAMQSVVGHFYDTADDAETLIRRPWDPTDNATPSGQSSVAMALLAYAALTGSQRHRDAAEAALGVAGAIGTQHPRSLGWALAAAEGLVAGPVQIAVATVASLVTEPLATEQLFTEPLISLAWRLRGPGAVVVAGPPDADGIELLAQRPLVEGRATAYVCRAMVCQLPVTDESALRAQLCA